MRVLLKRVSGAPQNVDVAERATVADLHDLVAVASTPAAAGATLRFVFRGKRFCNSPQYCVFVACNERVANNCGPCPGRVLRAEEELASAGVSDGSTIFVAKAAAGKANPRLPAAPAQEEPQTTASRMESSSAAGCDPAWRQSR